MNRTGRVLGLAAVAAMVAVSGPQAARAAPLGADEQALVKGNNAFALDLYAKLKEKPGNLFLSPYSISTALAMTYAGARGNTEAQMAKVLHFGVGQDKLHGLFKAVGGVLDAGGKKRGYQLSVANALWGQQGYGFLKDFLNLTQANYGAGLRQVDFARASEAARQRINQWVEKQTNSKIKDLIPPGVLKPLTRLVLTNAIYFKGDWASQFKKSRTKDAPFTLADGTKAQAPMMNQTEKFGYMETREFQGLAMPYAGKDLSMVVFLPRRHDGLGRVEASLNAENLAKWLRRMRYPRKVVVSVPKFKLTSQFRLSSVLKAMGMSDAFTMKANFSGMNGRYDLYISAVIHKAFVDVNEEGTEAAAATAVVMTYKSAMPRRPPVFRADHPFLFLIVDKRTGSVLFLGRVTNPKE